MDVEGDTPLALWLNGSEVETMRIKLKGTDVKPFIVPDEAGDVLLNNGVAERAESTDDPQQNSDKARWQKMNEKWEGRKKPVEVK
jgi:hypothetical protein